MDEIGTFIICAFFWVVIGGGVGVAIGSNKGRGVEGFWLGFLLGPIGWIITALLDYPVKYPEQRGLRGVSSSSPATSERKKCPFCAELILREAIKCRFCGSDLTGTSTLPPTPPREPAKPAMVSCRCNVCSGEIPFNEDGFDYREPPTVTCPHCGLDTLLYVPHKGRHRA